MQLFKSNGLFIPSPPAGSGYDLSGDRVRYGGRGLHRRNENGLLAVVERHRDEIRRSAALPQPANPVG